jgi:hypothetical protein
LLPTRKSVVNTASGTVFTILRNLHVNPIS